MKEYITLFLILFMQSCAVAYLCIHTTRDSLRRPLGQVALRIVVVNAVFSMLYALIPPQNALTVVVVTALAFLGWWYICSISSEDKGKIFFILLLCMSHLLFSNSVWLILGTWLVMGGDVSPSITYYTSYGYLDILMLGIPLVALLPVFRKMLDKLWQNMRGLQKISWSRMALVPIAFIAMYIVIYLLRFWGYINLISELITMLTTAVCLFITISQMIFSLSQAAKSVRYAQTLRFVEGQIALQGMRFAEISAYSGEIKRLKHDLRQHITSVYALLIEKKYSEAELYLSQLGMSSQEPAQLPLCENATTNAVVRHYITAAEKHGIQVDVAMDIPAQTGIANTDLCVILGNLFENAQAGCLAADEASFPKIWLRVMRKGDSLLVSMRNTFDGNPLMGADGSFLSGKKGGGTGLISIRTIAEKYGGRARFLHEGDVFVSEVLLYTHTK